MKRITNCMTTNDALRGNAVWRVGIVATLFVASLFSAAAVEAQPITMPGDLSPGDQYRLAFVTASHSNAQSTLIADYNTHVANDANAVSELAALGTTWFVLGSTETVDVRDNTGTTGTGVPIYRMDGTRLANDYVDLWDNSILVVLAVNADGNTHTGPMIIYTGSDRDGTKEVGSELGCTLCGAGQESVAYGAANRADLGWIKETTISDMLTPRPFYGISDVLSVPIPEPSTFVLCMLAAGGLFVFQRCRGGR